MARSHDGARDEPDEAGTAEEHGAAGDEDDDEDEEDKEHDQEDWQEEGSGSSGPARACAAVTRSTSSSARARAEPTAVPTTGTSSSSSARQPPVEPRQRQAAVRAAAEAAVKAALAEQLSAGAAALVRKRSSKEERPVGMVLQLTMRAVEHAYREADLASEEALRTQALVERALELAHTLSVGERVPEAHFLARRRGTWPFLLEESICEPDTQQAASDSTSDPKRKPHWALLKFAQMPSLPTLPLPLPSHSCGSPKDDDNTTGVDSVSEISRVPSAQILPTTQASCGSEAPVSRRLSAPKGRPRGRLPGVPASKKGVDPPDKSAPIKAEPEVGAEPASVPAQGEEDLVRRWTAKAKALARKTVDVVAQDLNTSSDANDNGSTRPIVEAALRRLPDDGSSNLSFAGSGKRRSCSESTPVKPASPRLAPTPATSPASSCAAAATQRKSRKILLIKSASKPNSQVQEDSAAKRRSVVVKEEQIVGPSDCDDDESL